MNPIYRPIKRWQTRLVHLHGDNGDHDSPISCTLYTADIVHAAYEGLAIRVQNEDEDFMVEYEALSYCWGTDIFNKQISCNGAILRITDNLYDALLRLRLSGQQSRYLWVDSICIDQKSDAEKAVQVWNMFEIYEKAKQVVVWLGSGNDDIGAVLDAAAMVEKKCSRDRMHFGEASAQVFAASSAVDDALTLSPHADDKSVNFASACDGLQHIYTRPWFRRMWVQQEIYAARRLQFHCGSHQFQWSLLLSKPMFLDELTGLDPKAITKLREPPGRFEKLFNKTELVVPQEFRAQIARINDVVATREQNLTCFTRFSDHDKSPLDLIETLLDTATLQAKDPRDYIYSLVRMTHFPAQAMPFTEWMAERKKNVFIPIDYTVELDMVLLAVTWAVLMEGGLGILAKFKTFDESPEEAAASPSTLPSWVIDWRKVPAWFSRTENVGFERATERNLRTAWAEIGESNANSKYLRPQIAMIAHDPPVEHTQFCASNLDNAMDHTKLIVHGTTQDSFFARGRAVWDASHHARVPEKMWKLDFVTTATDIVVDIVSYRTAFID